jgi:hypothetical protein
MRRIVAGTPIWVETTEVISTKVHKPGDHFGLRLVEPIMLDGQVIVPAGLTGQGEVIDSARPGIGGKPAKLVLAARFLDRDGQHVTIRGLKLGAAGVDRTNTSLAVSFIPYVGLAGIFVHGGEIDIPAGTKGAAKLGVDIELSPLPAAPVSAPVPAAAPAPVAPTSASTSTAKDQGKSQ